MNGCPNDSGPLKRSVSQHLYKSDASSVLPLNSHSVLNMCAFSSNNSNRRPSHEQTTSTGQPDAVSGRRYVPNSVPEDRYAALSSLFAEAGGSGESSQTAAFSTSSSFSSQFNSFSNLSKSVSSSSVMGPPAPVIPKPPSKQSVTSTGFASHSKALPVNANVTSNNNNNSAASAFQNTMQRCKSYGSLNSSDLRMTPVSLNSVGSSRGPSPLTIGFNNTVPLAVALQESISARFRGSDESRCEVQMLGSLKIAFPSGIVQVMLLLLKALCVQN